MRSILFIAIAFLSLQVIADEEQGLDLTTR